MTSTTRKPKTQRRLSYNAAVGTLHLTDERDREVGYYLDRLACDFGVAVTLAKIVQPTDGSVGEYDVLASDDGQADGCECLGWLRWSKCKHVSAIRCLRGRGLLS